MSPHADRSRVISDSPRPFRGLGRWAHTRLVLLAFVAGLLAALLTSGCSDDVAEAPAAEPAPVAEPERAVAVEQSESVPEPEPQPDPPPTPGESEAVSAALREWGASISTIRYDGQFSIRSGVSTTAGRSRVARDLAADRFWVQVEWPALAGALGRELIADFLDVDGEPYMVARFGDGSSPQWIPLNPDELDPAALTFLTFVARAAGQNDALNAAWLEQRLSCAAEGLGQLSPVEEESGPVWRLGCRATIEDVSALDGPAERFALLLIEEFVGDWETLRTLQDDESGLPDGDPNSVEDLTITAALSAAISRETGAPLSVVVTIRATEGESRIDLSAVFTLVGTNRPISFPEP